MKKCTYCGKEYPDDTAQCSIDGTKLEGEAQRVPPIIVIPGNPSPPFSFEAPIVSKFPCRVLSDRQLRIVELVLICVIAFGGSFLASIYSLFGQMPASSSGSMKWVYAIVRESATLALLWYILLRRSKSLADLGFGWKWSDLPWSLGLTVVGYAIYAATIEIIFYSGLTVTSRHAAAGQVAQTLFGGGIGVATLVSLCINPFFEELIVRAYVMTEVRQLTNSMARAILCSTLLQMSYHFYQGIPLALALGAQFFIFSIYYAKTNRITPVILAHLYADVGSTLWYQFHHQVATSFGAS